MRHDGHPRLNLSGSPGRRSTWLHRASVAALLVVMGVQLAWSAWADSLTYDEGRYIRAGFCAVTQGTADLEPTNPVGFKLLAGLGSVFMGPRLTDRCTGPGYRAYFNTPPGTLRRAIFAARVPALCLALVLGVVVYCWARAMLGRGAALVALVLVATEPNLVGHGHLATGDLPVALGVTVCLACHWKASHAPGYGWTVASGLGLGVAVVSKVSALYILPLLLVIDVCATGAGWGSLRGALRHTGVVALAAWALVVAVYLPLHDAATAAILPAALYHLAPSSWIGGAAFQVQHAAAGRTFQFLNGEVRVGRGFWTYFLEAMALKTTIGMIVLALAGAAMTWRHRIGEAILYLWIPAGVVVAAATVAGIDIGIRYILPAYPLLAIAASLPAARAASLRRRAAVGLCVASAVLSASLRGPGGIAYFNEFAGSHPEQFLSDSNLDWGQDAWRLQGWWAGHGRPALDSVYFGALPLSSYGLDTRSLTVRDQPTSPQVAASITELTSYGSEASESFRRLLRCPEERVASSVLTSRNPVGPCPSR